MKDKETGLTTNTTTTNIAKLTLADLLKVVESLKPEPPTIYTIDYKLLTGLYLPENTIIVSKDIGDELEKRGLMVKCAI